jgi:glutamate--cysteine ligase
MLFAQRDGLYLDAPTGMRFGEFLEHGAGTVRPVFGDWADHLTTIFTDARLKQHIELRGADCNDLGMTLALQALWKGLFYDRAALDEAYGLAPRLSREDSAGLRERAAREGLGARHAGVDVSGLAREVVTLAAEGLGRTAPDELPYLDILRERVAEGVSPADILLRNYEGVWHNSIERALAHLRIA